jgi:hypothetical protein
MSRAVSDDRTLYAWNAEYARNAEVTESRQVCWAVWNWFAHPLDAEYGGKPVDGGGKASNSAKRKLGIGHDTHVKN